MRHYWTQSAVDLIYLWNFSTKSGGMAVSLKSGRTSWSFTFQRRVTSVYVIIGGASVCWTLVESCSPRKSTELKSSVRFTGIFVFFMAIFSSPRYMYLGKMVPSTRAQKSVPPPYHHDCCFRLLGGSSCYGRFPPHWVSHCWRRRHVLRVGGRVGHNGASNALLF